MSLPVLAGRNEESVRRVEAERENTEPSSICCNQGKDASILCATAVLGKIIGKTGSNKGLCSILDFADSLNSVQNKLFKFIFPWENHVQSF